MNHYEEYTIDDFIQDPYFRKWVFGELDKDDAFGDNWYQLHIEKQEMIDQARSIVVGLQYIPDNIDHDEIEDHIQEIFKRDYRINCVKSSIGGRASLQPDPVFKNSQKLIENHAPVSNRHGPFFRGLPEG